MSNVRASTGQGSVVAHQSGTLSTPVPTHLTLFSLCFENPDRAHPQFTEVPGARCVVFGFRASNGEFSANGWVPFIANRPKCPYNRGEQLQERFVSSDAQGKDSFQL